MSRASSTTCVCKRGRHRPADDPAAEGIEHDRQIEEAGPGRNVRDISHPQHIGPIRGEVAVDEIGRLTRPIPHGRGDELATADAGEAGVPHQPGNTFATDADAGFGKINLEAGCSIRAFRGRVRRADFRGQRRHPSRHAQRSAASPTRNSRWGRHPRCGTSRRWGNRPGSRSRIGTLRRDHIRLPSEPGRGF